MLMSSFFVQFIQSMFTFNFFIFLDNPLVIVPEEETSLTVIGKKLHKKVTQIFDRVSVS